MRTLTIRTIIGAALLVIGNVDTQTLFAQPTSWLTRAADAVREQFDTSRPRLLRRSIELNDASLETLKSRLGWLGIELPLELSGDVTTRLGVEVDLSSLRDAKSYRIEGALSSKRLVVEGLVLRNLAANVHYVDGTLTLDQLVVTVPDSQPGAPSGRAVGKATMQLLPVGALSATLQLDGLPMEPFHRRIDAAKLLTGGRLDGKATIEAPVSNLRDVNAWRGHGTLTLTDLTASDRSVERVATRAELAEGTLTVVDLAATIEREQASGSGVLSLVAPFRYRVTVSVPQGELTRVDELFATALPERWSGRYELTANATGTLEPFAIDARGTLAGTDWTAAGVPVEAFKAAVASDGETVTLSALEAQVRDGRIAGSGSLTLQEDRTFSFRLRPERFDLAALDPAVTVALHDDRNRRVTVGYRALPPADQGEAAAAPTAESEPADEQQPDSPPPAAEDNPRLGGSATGDVEVMGQTLPFRLDSLEGSLAVDDLKIAGVTFDKAEIVADTENRTLVLSRLSLIKGDGRLAGEGRIGLDPPGAFSFTVRPEQFFIDESQPFFGEGIAELELPPISGMLDGELTAAGESQPFRLDSLTTNLAGDDIRVGRLLVDRFEIAAATADAAIDVSKLLVEIEDGRLTGQASLGLEGERPFEATLRPERFRIELLEPLFGEGGVIETDFPPVSGRVSGEVTLRGRAKPEEIDGVSGRLDAENATVSGVRVERAKFRMTTKQGIATIREIHAASAIGTLGGTGTLRLSAPYDYTADLAFDDVDLASLGRIAAGVTEEQRPDIETPAEVAAGSGVLPVDLQGLADVAGRLRGTLQPFVLTGDGTALSDEVVLDARDLSGVFKPTKLSAARFDWRYSERRLTLDDVQAGLGNGILSGTAAVPLGDAAAGLLDLKITNVELSELLTLPGGFGGVASGDIVAELGVANETGKRPISGRATLSIPSVHVGRATVGDVATTVSLERDLVDYDVQGRLFEGTLSAEGTWPLDEARRHDATGHVRWTGVNLARIAAVVGDSAPVSGALDLSGDYDLSRPAKGAGVVEVSNVRSRDRLITDRLQARITWADSTIRIENAVGGYAGGTVSFTAILDAEDPSRGRVEIALRRADAQRAVGWIPGLEPLEGTLEGRLRGNLGQLWRWQGEAEVSRGNYGPLAFSSWRIPVDIDANPRRAAIRIELRRTSIRAARGRASLNLTYIAGASNRFELDATFDGLEASRIIESDSLDSRVAGGRVSGTIELSSRNLRSIADLEGTVVASLSGSQAQNLPIIGSVVDVARLPTGGGGTIERGDVRVSVRRGVARVEEVLLAGPSFRLFAEGTVALSSGRLALDVVADTSPARVDRAIAGYLLRQFIDYGTPIGWIERANRFIAERAIYLRVTGTYRRPVVRVRPVEQLGQEAVRFFLNELAAPVGGRVNPR